MDAAGAGRLLYEQRNSRGMSVGLVLLAGGVLWGASQVGLPAVTLAGAVLALLFLAFAASNAAGRHLCYETRVVRHSLLGRRELAFEDLRSLSYGEVAVSLQGIPTRTNVSLRFEPMGSGRAIGFLVVFPRGKEAGIAPLREVRDRASAFVAERLNRELAERGAVEWTPGLRLTPDGIELAARGKGKGAPLLPFDGLQVTMARGALQLTPRGAQQPALSLDSNTPNFFPGLRLLESRLGRGAGTGGS